MENQNEKLDKIYESNEKTNTLIYKFLTKDPHSEPSKPTLVRFEKLEGKIEMINASVVNITGCTDEIKKSINDFIEKAEEKYATEKMTNEKFKTVNEKISFHTKIMYTAISTIVLAVGYAILNGVLK